MIIKMHITDITKTKIFKYRDNSSKNIIHSQLIMTRTLYNGCGMTNFDFHLDDWL